MESPPRRPRRTLRGDGPERPREAGSVEHIPREVLAQLQNGGADVTHGPGQTLVVIKSPSDAAYGAYQQFLAGLRDDADPLLHSQSAEVMSCAILSRPL